MGITRRNAVAPQAFLVGLAGSLAAALLVIAAMVLLGEYTKTRGRLFLTALTLAAFCSSALAPSLLNHRKRHRFLGVAGMLVPAGGFLLVTAGIWATPNPDAFWKAAAIVSILSAALFLASLILLPESKLAAVHFVAWASVGGASLAALLATVGIVFEVKVGAYWWAEFLVVVFTLAGGLAAAVLARTDKNIVE